MDMTIRWIFWGFCRNLVLKYPLHYLSSRFVFDFEFGEIFLIEKRLLDSKTRRVRELATPQLGKSGSRHGEPKSRYSKFLKFSIDFPDFKQLNQPFKRSIWQKRSQGCNGQSPLIYLKVWEKLYL